MCKFSYIGINIKLYMSATAYHYTDIWKTQTPNYRYDSNNNKAIKHLITGMTQIIIKR
jgi:hypothetical protein